MNNKENLNSIGLGDITLNSQRNWLTYWPFLIPLFIYLPGILGWIPFSSPNAEYTDLLISHYPNAAYLKRALLEFHQIPLWSPTILSGYPFAANPLSGLWYPLGWPALLFPLPQGLSVLLALHALWGGVGMYVLLREEGMDHWVALFGGLAFELMPKVSAHYGAGHITLLYAFSWTPWLLFTAKHKKRWAYSGLCLAGIFLADPRWAAFSGVLWLGYNIAHSHYKFRKLAIHVGKSVLLGGLLAGPLLVPLLQYVSLSTRWKMSIGDIFTHSTSFVEFIGLLFPPGGRAVESAMYPGGIILVLVVLNLTEKGIRKRTQFYWITAGISALYALGSNVPGLKYLAYLPGINLLRVPSRSLFILDLSLIIIASYILQEIVRSEYDQPRGSRILVAFGFFSVFILGGIGYLSESFRVALLWGMGSIALGVITLYFRDKILKKRVLVSLLFMLIMVDGMGAAMLNINFRPEYKIRDGVYSILSLIGEEKEGFGHFRTYSPSYSVPQHIAVKYQLEMADGVDPMQLGAYVEFMEQATGIPNRGYSVTLPPFPGNPSYVNQEYIPDLHLLGLLNVNYIFSAFELPMLGMELIHSQGGLYIYRNLKAFPRAWIQKEGNSISLGQIEEGKVDWDEVEVKAWRPNQIILKTNGPGKVVLSEIAYPGWKVKVDGEKSSWAPVFGIMRGVDIPEGEHVVEYMYRPKTVYIGLICFLVGSVVVINDISVNKKIG
ncbi:MAG: YfhO family protein [Anaerolineales bacterium]